jgi:RimJ/RimL family protein N-acetyltransferase
MEYELIHLNQPIGLEVTGWKPPPLPRRVPMTGRFCRLEPLDPAQHAESLFIANSMEVTGRNWTYLPYGPFDSLQDYRTWLEQTCTGNDPLFFAVINAASQRAVGLASYLRIMPDSGSLEIGHLNFSPLLQRTPAATEAMYLMMAHAFTSGYRRLEWKCDALNEPSRTAAQRLGLSFEGIFRQATLTKGRNRDTAWFAAIDREWPALRDALEKWLAPANFDKKGRQKTALSLLTAPLLAQNGK